VRRKERKNKSVVSVFGMVHIKLLVMKTFSVIV